MGQRPFDKQNWQRRKYTSFSPHFRIDTGNPQMGLNGSDVYNLYGVNDERDVSLVGMSFGGMFHIYNDQSIEIIGGQKSTTTAGNNVKIEAGNKIELKSNIANCDALSGNLAPENATFMNGVFRGTYVIDKALGTLGGFL